MPYPMQVSKEEQAARDARRLELLRNELANSTDDVEQAALTKEITRTASGKDIKRYKSDGGFMPASYSPPEGELDPKDFSSDSPKPVAKTAVADGELDPSDFSSDIPSQARPSVMSDSGELDPADFNSTPEAPSLVRSLTQGASSGLGGMAKTGAILLGGTANAISSALGGPNDIADPLLAAGDRASNYLNTAVLSKEEQAAQGLGGKIAEGVGGVAPMLAMGPLGAVGRAAMVPTMAATGAVGTGTALSEGGATDAQAAAGAVAGGVVGGVLGVVPAVAGNVPKSAALGAVTNVLSGMGEDKVIHDIILRPDQEQLRKQYEWDDVEKNIVRAATGGVTGAGLKYYEKGMGKLAENRRMDLIKNYREKMGLALDEGLPDAIPILQPRQGQTHKQLVKELLDSDTASWHDINGVIMNDPHAMPSERALAETLRQLGTKLGLDTNLAKTERDPYAVLADGSGFAGVHDGASDISRIKDFAFDGTDRSNYYVLLHEGVHAATGGALHWYDMVKNNQGMQRKFDSHKKAMFDAIQKMEVVFNEAKLREAQKQGYRDQADWDAAMAADARLYDKYYGFTNIHEFASEALTSRDFQDVLRSHELSQTDALTYKNKGVKTHPNLWESFKQSVRRIISSASGHIKTSMLDVAMDHVFNVVETTTPGMRNYFRRDSIMQSSNPLTGVMNFTPQEARSVEARNKIWAERTQDRWNKLDTLPSKDPIIGYMLRRWNEHRKNSNTKVEFAKRLSDEMPNDPAWDAMVTKHLDNLWENPEHLNELAGKYPVSKGVEALWSRTTPNLDEFIEKTLPGHVTEGQVVKKLGAYEDLPAFGTQIFNSQTLRLLKGDKIAGKIMKWVHERTLEYRTIKAISYERAKGYQKKYNNLSKDEQLKLLDTISEFQDNRLRLQLKQMGETRIPDQMLRQRGHSEKAIEAYRDMADGTDYMWSLIEIARNKLGYEPIERIPAYMPHIWTGAYKVMVKRIEGDKERIIEVKGFNNKWKALSYIKELESGKYDQGGVQLRAQRDDRTRLLYRVQKFEDVSNSLSVTMHEHMDAYENMLSIEPDTLDVLQRIENNSMRGFSKHLLEQQNISGWIGEKGSQYGKLARNKIGLLSGEQKKMLTLYENYAKNVSEFYGNVLFMDEVMAPLLDTSPSRPTGRTFYGAIFSDNPKLTKHLKEFAYNFTGENLNKLKFVDDMLQQGSIKLGIDPLLYRKTVRDMKNWLSISKLSVNPGNYIANILQPANALGILQLFNAQMYAQAKSEGQKVKLPNVLHSFGKGLAALINPKDEHLQLLQWAQHSHIVEPQIEAELQTNRGPLSAIKTAATKPNQAIEGNGKKLSLLIAYEHMKQIYKDPTKAREAAMNAMEMTMVNYDRTERPLMYQNYGIGGEMISPFAVFRNAYLGNTLLVLKQIKDNPTSVHNWAPFMMMQAVYLGLAGSLGMIGMSEYDQFAKLMNDWFPEYHVPTMAEIAVDNGWSDVATYGTISTVLGANIASSMNAVALDDSMSVAMLPFMQAIAGLAATGAKEGLSKVGVGKGPTLADYQPHLNALAPGIAKPWLNEMYTGDPLLKPKATSPEGMIRLTPEQLMTEKILGKPALDTVKEGTINLLDTETQRHNQKVAKEMVQIAVEHLKGIENTTSTNDAFIRWREVTKGEWKEFQSAVKDSLEGQRTTYYERLTRGRGPSNEARYQTWTERWDKVINR